jgi:hypothetical protein
VTEQERKSRLNEIGWEIASMFPSQRGCYVFGIVDGKYKGVKYEDNIPPGQRPTEPIGGGY